MSKSKFDPRTLFLMGNKVSEDSSDTDTETTESSSSDTSFTEVSSSTSTSESSDSRRIRGDIIYILELKGGKYYIGTTQNFTIRLAQHESGVNSAAWVVLHGYNSTVRTFAYAHKLDEDNEVKKMMMKYGINNVRGGSYSNVTLTNEQNKTLERELGHARNECFKCGRKDHYAKNCLVKVTKPSTNQKTVRVSSPSVKDKTSTNTPKNRANSAAITVKGKKEICKRCGRTGHIKLKCFAKTLLSGTNISDLNYCFNCGREDHSKNNYTSFTCAYKTNRNRVKISTSPLNFCVKCGRDSHALNKCYLKTKHTGEEL